MEESRATEAAPACVTDPDAEFVDDWEIIRGDPDVERSEFDTLKRLRSLLLAMDHHPACKNAPLCANPYVLLRQLRSSGTLESAAKFVGKSYLEWRVKVDLDAGIAAWREEFEAAETRRAKIVRDYFPLVLGFPDKYGVPVMMWRAGVTDTTGLMREMGARTMLIHALWVFEQSSEFLTQACRRNRKVVAGQLWIVDCDNNPEVPDWSHRMTFGLYPIAHAIAPMKYPVVLRKVIIIRTGPVIQGIWNGFALPLFKTLCSGRSLKNVKVYSSSCSSWKSKLRAEADEEHIPAFLMSDKPEILRTATPIGGIIPEATPAEKAAEAERAAKEAEAAEAAKKDAPAKDDAADDVAATPEPPSDDGPDKDEDAGAASSSDEEGSKEASVDGSKDGTKHASEGEPAAGAAPAKDAVSEGGPAGVDKDGSKVARAEEEKGDEKH